MGDWLGTGASATFLRQYRPFEDARAFVHSLKLTSHTEWRKYCQGKLTNKGRLPEDIPAAPNRIYRGKGWISYGDWLGTDFVATRLRKYRSFEEARAFVQSLGLRSESEWRKYRKGEMPDKPNLPHDIPSKPDHVYKNQEWMGWKDWLGNTEKS